MASIASAPSLGSIQLFGRKVLDLTLKQRLGKRGKINEDWGEEIDDGNRSGRRNTCQQVEKGIRDGTFSLL